MTAFFTSQTPESKGHLGALADEGVRQSLAVAVRLLGAMQRGEDIAAALAAATEVLGASLSPEMIELALANAGDAPVETRANKLAFQLLSTIPSSPIAQLLGAVAARAFRRAGPAFGPLIDADDLLSLLRWKLWILPAEHFAPTRILRHPGLAAYVSVIARRIVIDECRAIDNRGRTGIEPETIETAADPRTTLDAVLDDLDLLQRFAAELPNWEAALVDVLAGEVERDDALRTINRKREASGLSQWSADSMRTAVHRARKRLRDLLVRTPSTREQDAPTADVFELHAWRRFWGTREGVYSLSDDGFLFDPESEVGRHVHDVVAIEQLEGASCLVLLGEPGIGKSTVIRQELQRLTSAGQRVLLVDLSRTSSGDAIRRAVERANATEASPVFLFFDALDEGLSRNAALPAELISIIGKLDGSRARIRFACRTLEWPPELEGWLRQQFNVEAFRVQELLPLRRIDVIAAANDHGVDGTGFVREVRERDATPLAIRPISLQFLLAMFSADGALPHSKARLFDEGSLILCSEAGALSRGRNRRNPDVFRRRAIAARLATASTFANRHTIVRGEVQSDSALPANIAVGDEQLSSATYAVDASAVEDVLVGTALFTARTATVFGWNHQSYREFLAAWYLAQHDVGVDAAERLYFPDGLVRVPGPLREIAAWHATFVPALFDALVEREPELLLHSDGAAVSSESRAQLVRGLLDRMARYEALDSRYYRSDYRKLAHPQLADQLRSYIKDRSANIIVRRAAMDIAWSCEVHDLVEEMAAVLVDRGDELQAREVAAHALAELGGERVRDLFTALLAAGFEPDPNDGIRGSVLSFLWPKFIDAPTLFGHLALPKRDDYLGLYQRFISDLASKLQPEDLVLALEWIEAIGLQSDFHVQHAQSDLIDRALRFADRDDVRAVLVRIIRTSLHGRIGVWHAYSHGSNRGERTIRIEFRRVLAHDLICNAADFDVRVGTDLLFFKPPLIGPDDIQWIVELARSSDDRVQRSAGRCVAAIYFGYGYPTDVAVTDAVVSLDAPAFQEPLRTWLDPVELGSEIARNAAGRWNEAHAPKVEVHADPPEPTFWSVAGPLVIRVEAGDLQGWVELVAIDEQDIPNDAVWVTVAASERERVLIAALRYLQGYDAPDIAWLDVTTETPWSVIAARVALGLLAARKPAMLDALTSTMWRRWCPVLVALSFPTFSKSVRNDLIGRCAALEELGTTILRVGRRDNRPGRHVFVLSELPEQLPEPLLAPLLLLAAELHDDASFERALRLLLDSSNEDALVFARTALNESSPSRAARVARALLPHDATQWSVVIARMQREREFIDAFAPLVAHREDLRDDPFRTLTAQQAAELALVLMRQYPLADDRRGPRGVLTLPDYLERLQRRTIGMLREAGTSDAIRALEWLRDQEPEREVLRYILIEAKQKLADTAWQPLVVEKLKSTVIFDGGAIAGVPAAELVPSVVFAAPPRRDAGHGEVVSLLDKAHILVETATAIETTAVHAAMQPLHGEQALIVGSIGLATYTIGLLGNYAVAHFQSDMGSESPNAAPLATNDAILETRAKLVVQVGIAFGLQPAKQHLGDVLVAQHVTSYEMIKLKPDSVEERGETLRADATLIERIQAHGRTWQVPRADGSLVAVHVGQMLSGAKLVNNRDFRDGLVRRFPSALGGEMEGIGAYAAAFRHRVPVMLVKAICDWADGTKNDRAQPFAAFTAVDLVRHVLGRPDALAALSIPTH